MSLLLDLIKFDGFPPERGDIFSTRIQIALRFWWTLTLIYAGSSVFRWELKRL